MISLASFANAGFTCGDLVKSDGLGRSSSQSHAHALEELLLGEQVLVAG